MVDLHRKKVRGLQLTHAHYRIRRLPFQRSSAPWVTLAGEDPKVPPQALHKDRSAYEREQLTRS